MSGVLLPQGTFAEGYDPPELHGDFVHVVFWVRRGKRKIEVDRVILPRAVVYGPRPPPKVITSRKHLHS